MLDDPLGLVTPRMIGLARAAVRVAAHDLDFVVHGGPRGVLRLRIVARSCTDAIRELHVGDVATALTVRQLEVLTLVALGRTNRDISGELGITPKTVSSHLEGLFNRLGVDTRAAAAAMAVNEHLMVVDLVPAEHCPSCPELLALRLAEAASVRGGVAPTPDHIRATPDPLGGTGSVTSCPHDRLINSPLRIGTIVPDTLAGEASDMVDATELAVRRRNARGRVQGRLLEHIAIRCDVFDVDSMRHGLSELADRGVDALILGYNLDYPNMVGFLSSVAGVGVPSIHASTSRTAMEAVSQDPGGLGSIFHICGSDDLYGRGLLDLLEKELPAAGADVRGLRLAVVAPPPGMTVVDEDTYQRIEDLGVRITVVERASAVCTEAERSNVRRRLELCAPDLVLAATFQDEDLLAEVLDYAASRRPRPLVHALFTPSLAGLVDRHPEVSEGLLWATQTGTYGDVIGARFMRELKDFSGRAPGYSQAGVHYDAVELLTRAWSEAHHPRDYAEVVRQLRTVTHRGVNGSYWLDNEGQAPLTYPYHSLDGSLAQANLTYQVRSGISVVVCPRPYAQAEIDLEGTVLLPSVREGDASLRREER